MRKSIRGCQDALDQLRYIQNECQEVMAVLFLTTRHQVIVNKIIFRGTIDGAIASPREILKEALEVNAARMIVAHNHPSGDADPSPEDREFTARLATSCELMGIPLLDHLIIGTGKTFYSFAGASSQLFAGHLRRGKKSRARLPTHPSPY